MNTHSEYHIRAEETPKGWIATCYQKVGVADLSERLKMFLESPDISDIAQVTLATQLEVFTIRTEGLDQDQAIESAAEFLLERMGPIEYVVDCITDHRS
jgi:hypothetical protein